jgi:anti-sigma B factor antagonist
MDMQVRTYPLEGGVHVVAVEGEVDVYTAPRVKDAIHELIEAGNVKLAVNLEGVKYIDSTGLSVFVSAQKKLQEKSGRLVLITTNPRIHKVLTLTGLSEIFAIYKDEAEAAASFDGARAR